MYVAPIVAFDYILLVSTTTTDDTGRYKLFTSIQAVVDDKRFYLAKVLLEPVAVADRPKISLSRPAYDSTLITDAVYTFLLYQRLFDETPILLDSTVYQVAKRVRDTQTIIENAQKSTSKRLSTTQAVTDRPSIRAIKGIIDSVAVTDNLTRYVTFSRLLLDVQPIGDNAAKQTGLRRTDVFGTTDSGIIVMQDYVDPTYFLQDYVGTVQAF